MLTISASRDQAMVTAGKLSGKSILESIKDGTAMISKTLASRLSDLSVLKMVHAELVKLKSKELRCSTHQVMKLAAHQS
jgi:hypothetical protein